MARYCVVLGCSTLRLNTTYPYHAAHNKHVWKMKTVIACALPVLQSVKIRNSHYTERSFGCKPRTGSFSMYRRQLQRTRPLGLRVPRRHRLWRLPSLLSWPSWSRSCKPTSPSFRACLTWRPSSVRSTSSWRMRGGVLQRRRLHHCRPLWSAPCLVFCCQLYSSGLVTVTRGTPLQLCPLNGCF